MGAFSLNCQAQASYQTYDKIANSDAGNSEESGYCICYKSVGGSNAWDNQANYKMNSALTKGRQYTLAMDTKHRLHATLHFGLLTPRVQTRINGA